MTCKIAFQNTGSATTTDAITSSLPTRVFSSALSSTSTSKVPKDTTSSAVHVSTYVATGVFISTLASVTASKSTSASTSVSTTVSTSVYNISSANFPISVSGTASFLTQAIALSSKSTSTAANLLSKVLPTLSPYK